MTGSLLVAREELASEIDRCIALRPGIFGNLKLGKVLGMYDRVTERMAKFTTDKEVQWTEARNYYSKNLF